MGKTLFVFGFLIWNISKGISFLEVGFPIRCSRAGTLLPTKIARESKKACLKKR